ncbi:MAG: hypothetical protein Q9191_006745 [Dirinaria sp. TL-2023a]
MALGAIALIIGGTLFLYSHLAMQDAREPPQAPTPIPLIGHLIGLARSKFNYHVQLSHEISSPIFTIKMLGQKMYVVTNLDLVQAIQKLPKVLAFSPIAAKFASQACGSSTEAHDILMKNVNGDEGNWGLSMESHEAMRTALKPGAALDDMNRLMMQNIAASLDDLTVGIGQTVEIRLSEWVRDSVTAATTNSVYGPQSPFKERDVANAFWEFENDLMSILVGIMPSFRARRGIAGRATVAKAFEKYFLAEAHEQASMLAQVRYETSFKNGIPVEDIARYEVGGALALLVNTAPAAFWMLLLIYAHPGLLEDIREEVGSIMTQTSDSSGITRHIDITSLKSTCRLLTSTFQEVLRYRSMGTSVRQVMEDTLLEGQWLLKKDSMIQMPSRVMHSDSSLWGHDVDEFNPRRFLKVTGQPTSSGKAPPAAAFRAFGGGSTLCPGRHFATNEILTVVTMFVMRYDMVPQSGQWTLPTVQKTNVAAVVMEPDTDIEVLVSRRKGYEKDDWSFGLRTSDDVFAVVAEDRAK